MVGIFNGATGFSKSQLGSTGATPIDRRVATAHCVPSSESPVLVPVYPTFYPLKLVLQLELAGLQCPDVGVLVKASRRLLHLSQWFLSVP